MKLLIVIVNYRTANLTKDCLYSIANQISYLADTKVVVTDNASGDDSVELINSTIIKENWSNWVELIPLDHNGGYAFGNNIPIRRFLQETNPPDYFLLLNPDTVVLENSIQILLDFLETNDKVGIVGSRLEYPDGTPQRSAFRFHTILSELDNGLRLGIVSKFLERWVVAPPVPSNNCQTEWLSGASMMVRRKVFEDIGLIDEEYFMYYEDVDFCLQATKAGWQCWYVPSSRIIHFVGQSSGITNPNIKKRRPQYWFEARSRYFIKNYGWFYAILSDLTWICSFSTWQVRKFIQGKTDNDPPYFLIDFLLNSILFKPISSNLKKILPS